tara:strand:- start:932 stop:2071 length:1140 start_codon:yes stop_codon:yes gene_type:complete
MKILNKKIPLCVPSIGRNELKIASEILKSKWLTHGKYNDLFEQNFAKYIGVKYALSLNSCTSALELAIKANGLKKKDEVIVPSFTWVASANAILNGGATPVFCDSDIETRNTTARHIEKCITKKTKAIMIVHYGGQCCDMDGILKLVRKYDLILIEDSAETIGSKWKNRMAGSFGIGCFSFFPTKNITTGEGGMITSNDKKFIDKCKLLIAHGIDKTTYQREYATKPWIKISVLAGHNYRLSNLLAGIGFEQLKRINKLNTKRVKVAKKYYKVLGKLKEIQLPIFKKYTNHTFQTFSILVPKKDRENLLIYLNLKGIGASVHFTPALHQQRLFKKHKRKKINLKNSEIISDSSISLPIYPDMKDSDIYYVCKNIIDYFK